MRHRSRPTPTPSRDSHTCRNGRRLLLATAEGTLYPSLHRLERDGLLTSSWSVESGRRRRVYELTRRGRAAASDGRAQWSRLAHAVEAVLA